MCILKNWLKYSNEKKLLKAIRNNSIDEVKRLLDVCKPSKYIIDSPLVYSVFLEHTEIVELILHANPPIDEFGKNENTALQCICHIIAYGKTKDRTKAFYILNKIIDYGADLNLSKNNNPPPIGIAAFKNDYELVEILIKHGADLSYLWNVAWYRLSFEILSLAIEKSTKIPEEVMIYWKKIDTSNK